MNDHETIKELLPYVYMVCDQTVQCGICGAIWWGCEEDLDENWHNDGCWAHAAMVKHGLSKDIRKSDGDRPAMKPCLAFVESYLESLRRQMFKQEPPTGMSPEDWRKAIIHMMQAISVTPVDVSAYEHHVGVLDVRP